MNKKQIRGNSILSAIMVVFLSLVFVFSSYLSQNYNRIYNIPKSENCSLDLSGYRFDERKVDYLLNGDFEFFYGQWIESEQEIEQTGIISLPSHWNDVFDLSPSGYASYRIRIEGVKENDNFSVVLNGFRGAFRAFINHKLVASSGTLSKGPSSFVSGYMDFSDPFEVTGEENLELVLEIGYNTFGGFYSVPWLTASRFSTATASLSSAITAIIVLQIGMLLLLCLISFFFFHGVKKTDPFFLFDFLLCLFLALNQLTCKDGSLIFAKFALFDYRITATFSFLFLIAGVSFLILKINTGVKDGKRALWIVLPLFVLIGAFSFTKWNLIAVIALLLSLFFLLFIYIWKSKDTPLSKVLNSCSIAFVLAITGIELLDYLGFLVFGSEGVISIFMIFVAIISAIEIGRRAYQLSKSKIEGTKTLQNERAKSLALQIQPHFIFNSLSSIQALYRESQDKGEDALLSFSSHLRRKISSFDKELVPLDEELDTIENFTHLYSLERQYDFNVCYDIDADGFLVPAFSLEPFVENSLKHASLMEKSDGKVIISTKEENGVISIIIQDNGKGFSLEEAYENGHGLKNAKERLTFLLSATVDIISNETGTTISIHFKRSNNEKRNHRG